MARNNFSKFKIVALSLASLAVLSGCDAVEARPADATYNANILNLSDVTHNTISQIYKALVSEGDTNSEKVLKNALYLYSTTIYGNFFDTTDDAGNVVKGLKTRVDAYMADNTKTTDIQEFADKYEAYKGDDGKGVITKVVNFYVEVLNRIRASFLTYVQNSSYQIRNQFVESKFYDAQSSAYYTLTKHTSGSTVYPYNTAYKTVNGNFRLSEVYAETGKLILDGQNGKKDGDVTNAYFKDIFGTYENYIDIALLPDIYRNELIVQYLYTENYSPIRQTAERKLDFVSLAENEQYSGKVGDLMRAYAKNVLSNTTYSQNWATYGFSYLGDLYKGTVADFTAEQTTMASTIYTDAGWTVDNTMDVTVDSWEIKSFYKESAIGTILASYKKILAQSDRFDTDATTLRNDFTSSNTYTVETGLAVKVRALIAADKTTHGWYTKSGITSLPSTVSSRVFKIQVANEVDATAWNATTGYADDVDSDLFSYGHYRGGNYYAVPEVYETTNPYPYIIKDSSNWCIVKVDEAVKQVKLTPGSTGTKDNAYYDNMPKHAGSKDYYGEQVARTIAYGLSSSDTWKSNANQYYVEQMAVLYHDTYVYEYFKKTFPDIFD